MAIGERTPICPPSASLAVLAFPSEASGLLKLTPYNSAYVAQTESTSVVTTSR